MSSIARLFLSIASAISRVYFLLGIINPEIIKNQSGLVSDFQWNIMSEISMGVNLQIHESIVKNILKYLLSLV